MFVIMLSLVCACPPPPSPPRFVCNRNQLPRSSHALSHNDLASHARPLPSILHHLRHLLVLGSVAMKMAYDEMRPDIPSTTPALLKRVISIGWRQDPNRRPAAHTIAATLQSMISVQPSVV